MKKLKYIRIVLSLLTVAFVSCDDNLDITPEDALVTDIAIKDPANIQKLLVSTYGIARSSSSYGGNIALASELIANDGDIYWNGTYVQPAEFDEKAMLPDNSYVRDIWMNGYRINNQANIILASLSVVTNANDKSRLEGEAKFLRGLVYFDLGRLFSKPYVAGATNSQLAVPVILTPTLDPNNISYPSRNTLEQVYTQVIADLTSAYNLLPASNGIYANKYVAAALLARVYLDKGDYDNARTMANIVIRDSEASLTSTFAKAFNNSENSSEDLFAWQVTSQDASSNAFNTFWAGSDFGGRSGNPDVDVESQHWDIYDDPNHDERADFFYEADWWCTTKWKGQFANIPFIRLAEMYLIRAEANQRKNTSVGATPLEDITTLRDRSGASALSSVDLDEILMERRRELSFEGFALFDAKRLGRSVGSIPSNSSRLVMPIPLRELDANPNLVQNEGYN